jgi:uncharacterized protein
LSLYLDTSVLLPTLIQEEATPTVQTYMRATDQELLISDFAAAEVASALSRLVRTRLLDEVGAHSRLADFEAWRAATSSPIDLHAADARLAYIYVRRFDLALRAPDALHLAVARRLGATLVTLDRRMARAAAELGIAAQVPATA